MTTLLALLPKWLTTRLARLPTIDSAQLTLMLPLAISMAVISAFSMVVNRVVPPRKRPVAQARAPRPHAFEPRVSLLDTGGSLLAPWRPVVGVMNPAAPATAPTVTNGAAAPPPPRADASAPEASVLMQSAFRGWFNLIAVSVLGALISHYGYVSRVVAHELSTFGLFRDVKSRVPRAGKKCPSRLKRLVASSLSLVAAFLSRDRSARLFGNPFLSIRYV